MGDVSYLDGFVREVVVNRFSGESFKHVVETTSRGLRFHCPYCGDTYTVNKMPRGNLYVSKKWYKCFNDGCFKSIPLEKFIFDFATEYDIDITDIDLSEIQRDELSSPSRYSSLVITKDNTMYDYFDDMGYLSMMPSVEHVAWVLGLVDIMSIPQASKVRAYLDRRCAYSIPGINKRVYSDALDTSIFIMNVDDLSGKVLSYATRDISKKQYYIKPFSELLKIYDGSALSSDDVAFLDNMSSYFNILNVDMSVDVNVTEGQFDSLFVRNCYALQGVSKLSIVQKQMKGVKHNTLFDKDDGGYNGTMKTIGKSGFLMWTLLIDVVKKTYCKSVGDIVDLNKVHDVNELFVFMHARSGGALTYDSFNDFLFKYVSDNEYDVFFL